MKKYAIIHPDEDGGTLYVIENLNEFLKDPRGECGVERFLGIEALKSDPNYWDEGDGVLIEFEVIVPKEKTKEWSV